MDISNVFQKVNNVNSLVTPMTSNSESIHNSLPSNKQTPVKGEVINVTNDKVQIKIGNQTISGKVNLTGKLNIGDVRDFLVEIDSSGKVRVTVVPETADTLKEQHLKAVLKDLGQLTDDNLKFAKVLLENNLPVNKETLALLKRSVAMFGSSDDNALEKSMLMLKNDLAVNLKNAENVNNILDREQNVTKNLQNIDNLIAEIDDVEVATQLKELFSDGLEEFTSDVDVSTKNNTKPDTLLDNALKNTEMQANSQNNVKHLDNPQDILKVLSEALENNTAKVTESKVVNQNLENTLENTLEDVLENTDNTDNVVNNKETSKQNTVEDKLNNLKNLLGDAADDIDDINTNPQTKNVKTGELENALKELLEKNGSDKNNINKNNLDELLTKNVEKNFAVDKDLKNPKDLENHINDKLEKLDKALEIIKNSNSNSEVLQNLEKEITTLKDKMTFANEIKENVFLQIPFTINNKTANGELIVFKDKRGNKKNKDHSSALISLDTANLGIFEAYLVKKQNNVDIQFRFVEDFVRKLVQNNIAQLNNMLQAKNINIHSLTYKQIDEPFSVIDPEPTINDDGIGKGDVAFKFDVRA